jgi:hypothetical protein
VDLIELRQALRRNWVFGVVAMLIVGIAGTTALGPAESRYAARSTLLVTPRAEIFSSVSTGVLRVVLPNVLVVTRSADLEADARTRAGSARDTAVETEATFVRDSGVLTVTTRAADARGAITWNHAIAAELVERYEDDPYLIVESLDEATSAAIPGVVERNIDLIGVAILALFAGVLALFTAQRLRESGDIVARIRSGGLRVLGEVAVRGRRDGARAALSGDERVRRLALALSSTPGVDASVRIVVVAAETRPATAVVNAMRVGLSNIGLGTRHEVVLGPQLDDLASLHKETHGSSVCVAVLDPSQRVDAFIRDVRAVSDAEVPVLGVVVLKWGR